MTFSVKFVDPCPTTTLSLLSSPFSDSKYFLAEAEQATKYYLFDMVDRETPVDCGGYTIKFFYNDLAQTPLDSDLFEVEDLTNQFKVLKQ